MYLNEYRKIQLMFEKENRNHNKNNVKVYILFQLVSNCYIVRSV